MFCVTEPRGLNAALPAKLMTQVQKSGCNAGESRNRELQVVQGKFAGPRVDGWAVLCSRGRETTLLVFLSGSEPEPVEFWKTIAGDGQHLSIRSIKPVNRKFIAEHCQLADGKLPPIDHQGILDGFNGSVVHYYNQGKWLHLTVEQ